MDVEEKIKAIDPKELAFWKKILSGPGAKVLCHTGETGRLEGMPQIKVLAKRFHRVPVFESDYVEAGKIVIMPEDGPGTIELKFKKNLFRCCRTTNGLLNSQLIVDTCQPYQPYCKLIG